MLLLTCDKKKLCCDKKKCQNNVFQSFSDSIKKSAEYFTYLTSYPKANNACDTAHIWQSYVEMVFAVWSNRKLFTLHVTL